MNISAHVDGSGTLSPEIVGGGVTVKPAPVLSNTAPSSFAPPRVVVPNRSPLASAISPAKGFWPLEPLKLTSVVGALA